MPGTAYDLSTRLIVIVCCAVSLAGSLSAGNASAGVVLKVSSSRLSTRTGPIDVVAKIATPQFLAVRVLTSAGVAIAWIGGPSYTTTLRFRWDGRVGGQPLADGLYRLEAVVWPHVLASTNIVIDARAPEVTEIRADAGRPFTGDPAGVVTFSPNGDGLRDSLRLSFTLNEAARVRLDVMRVRRTVPETIWHLQESLPRGRHVIRWRPRLNTEARTYLLRLTVVDRSGNRRTYGGDRREAPWNLPAPVVRLLGVEAAFTQRSYAPGQEATLTVETDVRRLLLQVFRSGPEETPTYRNDILNGVAVTGQSRIAWSKRNGPGQLRIRIGDWPTGLYYVRLIAPTGQVGYAPFVVRPGVFGESRVAVVLPTNSWAAYNFRDADGDGWGDTWYAGGGQPVSLTRAFLNRGVPFRFRSYDLGFIRWLSATGKSVEFLAEEDLDRFSTGDQLAAIYDLVIFPGHTEYVTDHEYDVVQRYRDVGGNLWFLSANNFFWRVERVGELLYRRVLWRDIGRPEAALIGVQYLANDDGSRRGGYVIAADAPAWAWEGAEIVPGSAFGSYGIEIDARAPSSPPETQVLATIPDLFGAGRSAEMTYYELANGARVFAAGALDFGGTAERPAVRRLLENLWARTSVP